MSSTQETTLEGQNVEQSFAAAMTLLRMAAFKGHAKALSYLGRMYLYGRGVAQNFAKALNFLEVAADQGDASAQYSLGTMYSQGLGVAQDFVSAHMWVNIAAASGDQNAVRTRDQFARQTTPAQIAEAQKRARIWMEKHRAQ